MTPTTSRIHSWFIKTSIPDKYGLCVAVLIAIWLAYWFGRRCGHWVMRVRQVVSWRRLLQSPTPHILRWLDVSSWLQFAAIAIISSANMVAITLWTHSFVEVQKRAGSLAIIHLLALCTGFTFSLPADICHIERQTLAWLHRWFGRICVLYSLLHGSVIVSVARKSARTSASFVVPLLAACSLLFILPLMHAAFLRRHLQLVLKGHYMLAAIAVVALFYHLLDQGSVYRWVLLGGFCLWLTLSGAAFIKTMWRQKSWRGASQDAVARLSNGLLWLDISVPANWEMCPGQYVQLWLPRSKLPIFVQLPLFYVAYWENTNLHESSLTARLAQDALNSPRSSMNFQVYVLGPFGRPDRLDEYGTVLFVVEDIGLFRALSYIRDLVLGSRERKNTIRKLEVLWQVEQDERSNLANQDWVRGRIQHILNLDHRDRGGFDILNFRIYCLGPRPKDASLFPNSTRIQYYFKPIRPREELTRYMEDQYGKMVVAVCAGPFIRETIVKTVRPRTSEDLRLVDLYLEPSFEWLGDRDKVMNTSAEAPVWSGRTTTHDGDRDEISDCASVLSESTLTPERPESNDEKWRKQKIAEGAPMRSRYIKA
ncbi:hypothetical protein N7530_002400 [Penicillium desertorum]|uniref:FAD-binding FR-type domain-containing protein n=1 Tax=Penicillium desertorum TaxID=1303715 RepID=A0A9W9X4N6_9EURO|nr:hypothetical protein N7530_002400 [Penicillium desertorum]